jgi:hypothetical protein
VGSGPFQPSCPYQTTALSREPLTAGSHICGPSTTRSASVCGSITTVATRGAPELGLFSTRLTTMREPDHEAKKEA